MAPRSRRSAAAAVEVVEEAPEAAQEEGEAQEEAQGGPRPLKFKQPLVGRPGKQLSVGELLSRLEALLNELRTIDQEEAHRESLEPVAAELVSPSLLQHKDVGVRAWTCCCLVDMLRLFAPDAPYPAKNLKVRMQRAPMQANADAIRRKSSPSSSPSCCPSSPTLRTPTTASTCTSSARSPSGRASC